MKLEKTVRVLLPYKETINSFSVALVKRSDFFVAEQFYNCREVFHDDFPTTKNLLLCVQPYKKIRIINFFKFIEEKLMISDKSEVLFTQRKNIFFIRLNKFWRTKIKFSLLTLLIRSALRISKNLNLIKILEKSFYLKKTMNAVHVFFSGNTRYYGKKNSWYKEFKDKSMEDCFRLLKKR